MHRLLLLLTVILPAGALAAESGLPEPTWYFFAAIVPFSLLLLWSSARIRTAAEFYASGRQTGGLSNGLAITGDYLSAASFLGITGLILISGYSGMLYAVGFFAGWPLILILLADKLRSLGRYTLADVVSDRFERRPVVFLSTVGYFPVVVLYLAAQLVAVGYLSEYLFNLPYSWGVLTVGGMAVLTGITGRMIFSSRAQMIKAILILVSTAIVVTLALLPGQRLPDLFSLAQVQPLLPDTLYYLPGVDDTPLSMISLGLALMLGPVGLPHIMSRFFSVADERRARMSVFYATGFIGLFYILTFVMGFAAVSYLAGTTSVAPADGGNLAALHLAEAVGGAPLAGVLAAVLLTVLLSVLTSLTLAGSSALSHDWYALTMRPASSYSEERNVHRMAAAISGISAVVAALLFEHQNVAFIVGLAFAFAASVNVPLLLGSLYWSRLTTRGAVMGGWAGLLCVTFCTLTGPLVWVDILGFSDALFPSRYPALLSVTVAVLGMWYFSVSDRTEPPAAEEQEPRP